MGWALLEHSATFLSATAADSGAPVAFDVFALGNGDDVDRP